MAIQRQSGGSSTKTKPSGGPGSTVGTKDGIVPKTSKTSAGTGTGSGTGNGTGAGGGKGTGTGTGTGGKDGGKGDTGGGKVDTPTTKTTDVKPSKIPAYEIFKQQFKKYFDNIEAEAPWLSDLYKASQKYYDMGISEADIPDSLLTDADTPQSFKDRFKGIELLKKRQARGIPVKYIPNVAQYTTMAKDMKTTFQKYKLNSLGTLDNIADIIGNDVDAVELTARMDDAFAAIDNADEFLKKELQKYYPGISREDIALALLKGKEGSVELKKKVQSSNISARATEFGITSAVNAGNLYEKGYTAEDTRKGFADSAAEQKGLQNAATMFGDVGSGLLAEQQQGNITGVQTQRVEGLRSKARSEFQKQSGVGASSLKRTRSGQI
jgi:hypothetical protein